MASKVPNEGYSPLQVEGSSEQCQPLSPHDTTTGPSGLLALSRTSSWNPSMNGIATSVSSMELGATAKASAKWLVTEGDRNDFWVYHSKELDEHGRTDVFCQNDSMLAKDSGFSDVPKMLYPYKYFAAFLSIASLFSNVYSIASQDWWVLQETSTAQDEKRFLITKSMAKHIFDYEDGGILDKLVPALELVCLCFCLLSIFRLLVTAVLYPLCCKGGTEEEERQSSFVRWHSLASVFWSQLPYTATFSAMKMLYHVTPIVLSTEAYNLSIYISEKLKIEAEVRSERVWHQATGACAAAWFITSRVLCLIIGVDSFLVKFRIAEHYVNSDTAGPQTVLYCVVFLFQVLSIVNINRFVRERLFLFLFAGEDGILSLQEEARKDVWCALLSRQIWKDYGCCQFFVLMLSFDDYDYQFLVLDPSKKDY